MYNKDALCQGDWMSVVLVTFLRNISPLQKNIQKTNRDRRTGCPKPADEKKMKPAESAGDRSSVGLSGEEVQMILSRLVKEQISFWCYIVFRESVLLLSFLHSGLKEREREKDRERTQRKTYRRGWMGGCIESLPCLERSLLSLCSVHFSSKPASASSLLSDLSPIRGPPWALA